MVDIISNFWDTFAYSTPVFFFFFPWKSKSLPWNFSMIFGFPYVNFFFLPWKNLENCPWKVNCVRENFFQITHVKMETSVREKYNLLFPWNLMNFTFFCTREKKKPYVKIIDNFSFPNRFLPVKKKNPPVKKS